MKRHIIAVNLFVLTFSAFGADSFYCAQQHGYINIGMTQDQVISACGIPVLKRSSNTVVYEKIPVTQLIYTTLNQGGAFDGINNIYQRWSLPSGSQGTSLQINVINQKVDSMTINGGSSNAVSLCQGVSIEKGDLIGKVYSVCGTPSLVNQTYINQPVPKALKPEIWIYQVNPYQPSFSLTFINGTLQSID
jgi:hypothetical protein